jgi:adenylate cyclase
MRALGKRPSDKNPTMCTSCFDFMSKHHGGAEIDCSFLFADVRGSTALAESMSASDFRGLLDRFYGIATRTVVAHDGSVDKFVGDELVAMYFPLLSGDRHAERAVATAKTLLEATGHGSADGPWLPLGAGVHTGPAWIGAVGDGERTELTALGDTVNTTARLASVAGVGEILISAAAAETSDLEPGLERRSLQLKGKAQPTDVVVLRI